MAVGASISIAPIRGAYVKQGMHLPADLPTLQGNSWDGHDDARGYEMVGFRLLVLGSIVALTVGAFSAAMAEEAPNRKKATTGSPPKSSNGKPPVGTGNPSKGGDAKDARTAGKNGKADPHPKKSFKVIVRLSYNPGTAALPVIVAQERGFFRREGLVVSTIPVTSQRAVITSLTVGATDFATGSQAWLIDMAQADLPVRVVALSGYERQMELVVPSWEKNVKSVKDLKGKTVLILQGTHNFDAVPEFFKILAFNRFRLTDVKIAFFPLAQLGLVFSKNAKAQAAMRRRKIAAFFGYKEHTEFYVGRKAARVIMSNEDIRKLLGRNGPRPLFASKLVVEKHPETVQRFVNAWVAAQDYIQHNEEDAGRLLRLYLARQYGLTVSAERAKAYVHAVRYDRVAWAPQDIKETNINARMISRGRDILFSGIRDKSKRPFKTPPRIDRYIDNSFVEKAIAKLKEEKAKASIPGVSGDPPKTSGKPTPKSQTTSKKPGSDVTPDKAPRGK